MDILKTAIEWAKAEVFSSTFFILFGIMFLLTTIGFWKLGKTDLAKAYIIPTLVAGLFLLAAGSGVLFTNKSRISSFKTDYKRDATAFVQSEIARVDKTIEQYEIIAFKIFPFVIVVSALLIIFINKPLWRAISITTIALMGVLMLVDSNANSRIENYKKQLVSVKTQETN